MMELMHGAQFAKQYINNYLKLDIPVRLIEYRNGWNLSSTDLPTPEEFITYEPLALDSWPTIITIAISTNRLERIGYGNADPLYRVEYQMRTYVWVRAEGSQECTEMRDRLTTVVRSALLDYPCLKATDPNDFFRIMIDESSMREEFSDLTLLKGDRMLAGSYVAYNIQLDEIVSRKSLGTVDEIILRSYPSGAGEDLDSLEGEF
jgi:hypothetical protein